MKCGASLAHHRLLGSVNVDRLWLRDDVDLSPVPAQHLASLVSCVTSTLCIMNVSGYDLVSILSSVKCQYLNITHRHSLGREETWALVQAMESGVWRVSLESEVTLDIETLTEYSGQGVCRELRLYYDTADRYKEELKRTWARNINWKVAWEDELMFRIIKKC